MTAKSKKQKTRKKSQRRQSHQSFKEILAEMRDQFPDAMGEAWYNLQETIEEGEEEGIHPIPFPRFLELFKHAWNLAACAEHSLSPRLFPTECWGTDDPCELNTIWDVVDFYHDFCDNNPMLIHEICGEDTPPDGPVVRYTLNLAGFDANNHAEEIAKRLENARPMSEAEDAFLKSTTPENLSPEARRIIGERLYAYAKALLDYLENEIPILSPWQEDEL